MSVIQYVVRDGAGIVQRGAVLNSGNDSDLALTGSGVVSLNLRRVDIRDYVRAGEDLELYLADGRRIVLRDFYGETGSAQLFLNESGVLIEVGLHDDGHVTFAEAAEWGKWSELDALIFPDDPMVVPAEVADAADAAVEQALATGGEESTQALGLGLTQMGLGGLGGLGMPALGGAGALAGLTMLGGAVGGEGGGGTPAEPTVDNASTAYDVSAADDDLLVVSGTAEPGATIEVTIGGNPVTVRADDGGIWETPFSGESFPDDGTYTAQVLVTNPDGSVVTLTGPGYDIDTTPPELDIRPVEGDDIVNANELSDGVVIRGTSEPGANVVVTIGGVSYETVAGDNGNWRVTFAADDFPEGEYDAVVTAVATDGFGNATTTTSTIHIDTEGSVTLEPGTDGGEPVVNGPRADDGVVITGTTEPGSSVTVTFGGNDYVADVDDGGNWSVTIPAGDIDGGEYDVEVTVTATDPAGNTSSTTSTVTIDTETQVTVDPGYAGADQLIDAGEQASGVTFSGTSEPGASVQVTFEGTTLPATMNPDGTWSVGFTPAQIPVGSYDGSLTVTVTDGAGNTATETMTVPVDTTAYVAFGEAPVEGDNVVNAVEASDGIVLSGAAFPGSSVTVSFSGGSYPATVLGDGSWSVSIPAGDLPSGETAVTFSATSISPAGNPATSELTLQIDTVTDASLDTPISGDDFVNAADRAEGVTLTGTAEPGVAVTVQLGGATLPASVAADGTWSVTFPTGSIPQGEYDAPVVVSSTDAAGNTTSVTDSVRVDTTTNVSANTATMGGDGMVNAAEASAGVLLTGSAEPGSSVNVTIAGVTRPASVAGDGSWTVTWPAGSLPSGETAAAVTVTATDAAGNTATTNGSVDIDTLVRNFAVDNDGALSDSVISGPERAGGLTLTGTTEPGATVTLQLGDATRSASVDSSGNWSVTFAEGSIPAGEYPTTLTATTTDAAGNTSTLTESVVVDTVAGELALSSAAIEIDDIVNGAERADGVTINGTATPGMVVTVTLGDATTTALANPAGNWRADFTAAQIPTGTYDADVTATITDSYGNTKSVADSVHIDTAVDDLTLDSPVEGDDVISGAEASDGLTLTGTVEPGAVVSVKFGLVTHSATVAVDGVWTATFAAGEIPSGEYPTAITVTATDAAGNTAMVSESVDVDTLVSGFTFDTAVPGDGILNAAEAAMGLTLTGTVEAGSTVVVDYDGTDYAATVDSAGNWNLDLSAAQVGEGEFTAEVNVNATDAVGNTDTLSTSFDVDTVAPDAAYVSSFTRAGDVIRAISVPVEDDSADVTMLGTDGSVSDISYATGPNLLYPDETVFAFGETPPDGSHLVVTRTDDAGNSSSNLLALEDSGTDVVDPGNPGLDGINIDAIDLRIAENSDLTISADVLEGLSTNANTLTIHGSEDDTVTVDTSDGSTFAATGDSVTIGADSYNVYTLGDEGGTLIIDDEITIIT